MRQFHKTTQEVSWQKTEKRKESSVVICQIAGGSPTNPLKPCGCVGGLQFIHQECLKKKKRLKAQIKSAYEDMILFREFLGADLEAVKTRELCKQNLIIDVDNFNVNACRNHQQAWWNTAISDLD
ncbi:LOW QUALITY PROTEIN: putative E3 ubiquitin-protein ligase MARCHF10 [Pterocles gutturalis]